MNWSAGRGLLEFFDGGCDQLLTKNLLAAVAISFTSVTDIRLVGDGTVAVAAEEPNWDAFQISFNL